MAEVMDVTSKSLPRLGYKKTVTSLLGVFLFVLSLSPSLCLSEGNCHIVINPYAHSQELVMSTYSLVSVNNVTTSHYLCQQLFIGTESLGPAHTQRRVT